MSLFAQNLPKTFAFSYFDRYASVKTQVHEKKMHFPRNYSAIKNRRRNQVQDLHKITINI